MRPISLRILLLGLAIFLFGGTLILIGVEGGSGLFLGMGVAVLVAAAGILSAGGWLSRHEGDPLDQRRERRLWKSGPMGRKWLEGRRRVP
jgi:hypothetical protein